MKTTAAAGLAMVEALVAAALLGLGLLGAARLSAHALDEALQTRLQLHAAALAGAAMDCATARSEPCPAATRGVHQGVGFEVQLLRSPLGNGLTGLEVRVQWASGSRQRDLVWHTRVSEMPDWLGLSLP